MTIRANPRETKLIGGTDYERKRTFQADFTNGSLHQHKKTALNCFERACIQCHIPEIERNAEESK